MELCGLGPYRLDEVIARSAAATVYRATDTGHGNRTIALKVFAPHLSADPGFRERFRRDAGLLAGLRQPHVVPLHSYGVLDGAVYVDMRLVRGPSLAAALREGPLEPGRARALAEQLAAVQEDVRRVGLGERLIEPDDVLLTGSAGRGEFVQVVGLGLGRPALQGRAPGPAELIGVPAESPQPSRPPRRRALALTAALLIVIVAAVVTVVALRGASSGPTTPGLVTTISGAGGALAAATAMLSGRPVLVVAQPDAVRTWSLATGREVAPSIPVRARQLTTVELESRPVVVIRSSDQLIHVHDLESGRRLAPPTGRAEPDPGRTPTYQDRDVAAVQVQARRIAVGLEPTEPITDPSLPRLGLQARELPAGPPLWSAAGEGDESFLRLLPMTVGDVPAVVVLTDEHRIRVFDAATGAAIGRPIETPSANIWAIAVVDRDGRPVLATGDIANTIRFWDPATGASAGPTLTGHTRPVVSLSAITIGDRRLLLSSASDRADRTTSEARFWDLTTGEAVGPVLVGHPLARGAVAVAQVGGREVVAVAEDERITVWDVGVLMGGGQP